MTLAAEDVFTISHEEQPDSPAQGFTVPNMTVPELDRQLNHEILDAAPNAKNLTPQEQARIDANPNLQRWQHFGELSKLSLQEKAELHAIVTGAAKRAHEDRITRDIEYGYADKNPEAMARLVDEARKQQVAQPEGVGPAFGRTVREGMAKQLGPIVPAAVAAAGGPAGAERQRIEQASEAQAQVRQEAYPITTGVGAAIPQYLDPSNVALILATEGVVNPTWGIGARAAVRGVGMGAGQTAAQAAGGQPVTPVTNVVANTLAAGAGEAVGPASQALGGGSVARVGTGAVGGAGINVGLAAGQAVAEGRTPTVPELASAAVVGAVPGGFGGLHAPFTVPHETTPHPGMKPVDFTIPHEVAATPIVKATPVVRATPVEEAPHDQNANRGNPAQVGSVAGGENEPAPPAVASPRVPEVVAKPGNVDEPQPGNVAEVSTSAPPEAAPAEPAKQAPAATPARSEITDKGVENVREQVANAPLPRGPEITEVRPGVGQGNAKPEETSGENTPPLSQGEDAPKASPVQQAPGAAESGRVNAPPVAPPEPPKPVAPKPAPDAIGIRNAESAKERERLNLPPRDKPDVRSRVLLNEEAKKLEADDPQAAQKVIDRLRANPRYLVSDTEWALLTRDKVRDEIETQRLSAEVDKAAKSGDAEAESIAIQNLQNHTAVTTEKMRLAHESSGTAVGQSLSARQIMMDMNHSLVHMLAERTAAKGKPLTAEEITEIRGHYEAMQKAQEAMAQADTHAEEIRQQEAADAAIEQLKQQAAATAERRADVTAVDKGRKWSVGKWLDSAADNARKRIEQRKSEGRLFSGPADPEELQDYAILGAHLIFKKGVQAAQFAAEMVKIAGDAIRPYVQQIWNESNKLLSEKSAQAAKAKKNPQVSSNLGEWSKDNVGKGLIEWHDSIAGDRAAYLSDLREAVANGETGLHPDDLEGHFAADKAKLAPFVSEEGWSEKPLSQADINRILSASEKGTLDSATASASHESAPPEQQLKAWYHENLDGSKKQVIDISTPEKLDAMMAQSWKINGQDAHLEMDEGGNPILMIGDKAFGHPPKTVPMDAGTLVNHLPEAPPSIAEKMRSRVDEGASAADLKRYIEEMALNIVKGGVKQREPLLDELHKQVKEIIPDISRNEVRDILSGYGNFRILNKDADLAALRDIKQQSQKVAQLEALERGQLPKATGFERQAPSDETRALTKKVNEKKAELGIQATDPETQLKSTLASMKTRTRNLINDLQAEIDTGVRIVEGKRQHISDAELDGLRAQLAEVRKAHAEVFEKPGLTDEQRLNLATKGAERALANSEAALAEARKGNFQGSAKRTPMTSNQIADLRAKAEANRAEVAELRSLDPKAKADDNARANAKYRADLARREADIRARIARGDYGPRTKPGTMIRDAASEAAKSKYQRSVQSWENLKNKAELAARPKWVKAIDFTAKWSRMAVLSGPNILVKLPMASLWNIIGKPITEIAGGGIGRVPGFSRVFKAAPLEGGGFSRKAYGHALVRFSTEGMKEAWRVLTSKEHQSNLNLRIKGPGMTRNAIEMFGILHAAMKEPVKQFDYEYSLRKQAENAAAKDIDVTDPAWVAAAEARAYAHAEHSIFQEKRAVTEAFNAVAGRLGRDVDAQGNPTVTGQLGAAGVRAAMPVVTVPTNIIAQTVEHIIGLPLGAGETAKAFYKGIGNLKPEQADVIARHLKRGSLGAAMALVGIFAADSLGGFYRKGHKQDKDAVDEEGVRLNDFDISRNYLHYPGFMVAQFFATVTKVMRERVSANSSEEKGKLAGILAAAFGLAEGLPPVRLAETVSELGDEKQRDYAMGSLIRTAIPQGAQWAAKRFDEKDAEGNPVTRKPKGLLENLKMGIPGLRQTVPVTPTLDTKPKTPKQLTAEEDKRAKEGPMYGQSLSVAIPTFERMGATGKAKYGPALAERISNSAISPSQKSALYQKYNLTPPNKPIPKGGIRVPMPKLGG